MGFDSSSVSKKLTNSLNSSLNKLSDVFNGLSKGSRFTKPSSAPADQAVADLLANDSAVVKVGSRNASDASSAIGIADGAVEQIGGIASRLGELAAESANGTLSDEQRSSLQQEFSQLSQEANRIAATTQFNGKQLLQGGGITAQVGSDSSSNSQIQVQNGDLSSALSSISGLDIGTQGGAQAALDQVNSFVSSVSSTRGGLGASDARLDVARTQADDRVVGEKQAEAGIRDLDIAQAVAQKVSLDIQSQASVALIAQASKLNTQNARFLLG